MIGHITHVSKHVISGLLQVDPSGRGGWSKRALPGWTRFSGARALLHRSFTFAIITPIKPCHCNNVTLLSSQRKRDIQLCKRGAIAFKNIIWVYTHFFTKMNSRIGCLLIISVVFQGVISYEEQNGFVDSLDFGPIFDDGEGITSLASNPMAAALLKVDKSLYPKLFDTVVSSSIDSIQSRLAPKENSFAPETFGFNPIASQSFFPVGKSAKLLAQQKQQLQPQPVAQQFSPLRYDIRTVHDANYKVYKPEEAEEGKDILATLKKLPSVAAYFQPRVTEVEVAHPVDYRKEELVEIPEEENNYKSNPYIAGPARIRRYAGGRSRENLRKSNDEDDGYDYKAEYISRPKAFDSSLYSSAYKEDPKKEYEYPYKYDSGYDHKEYERIKELSEKQAAEIKQNPGNCVEVKKDGMSCMTCKDPKTGGNYESCSYIAEPKNNKYAYSKERKFDSNDDPEGPEVNQKSEQPKKSEKYQEVKNDESSPQRYTKEKPYSSYKREDNDDDSGDKYKSYYVHTSQPKKSESLRAASNEDNSENTESVAKPYDYKKALPGFYTDNEQKKDVEHVLAEFKKKDRSACKKVQKNGMTCFQCIDDTGLKNEECMFVSESAPKQSHLAYQEVKEFTSKPATLEGGNEGAESQTVTTNAPVQPQSASYVVANPGYGKKLKRKKTSPSSLSSAATNPVPSIHKSHKVKRSEGSQIEYDASIVDETNIAPPEEFAGADSKGAFWAETQPRYSAALGVTLPEYMLSRSEHEASFDETVAGA
ncbi:uncharacterized protein [Epargyreus clarus]|uniref:uncharacterized protein isoform X1 n=1 Tax=Epargyreus clarus TaxID=520877 RepID=UPI003C2AD0F2